MTSNFNLNTEMQKHVTHSFLVLADDFLLQAFQKLSQLNGAKEN